MMIIVRFLLLATAAVALREAGEEGQESANSIGNTMSKAKDAVELLSGNGTEFGDSKAFTMLLQVEVPPDNMEAFNEMAQKTSDAYKKDMDGVFLFHAFTSESHPNHVVIAQVFQAQEIFFAHMKTDAYLQWETKLKELGGEIVKAKFLGTPEFSEERKQSIAAGKGEYWQQTVGFARAPHHKKIHGTTFLIESSFNVPNDNLPTINTLNKAFISTSFDWDPTCFFARICLDPNHEGDETLFTYGGVYMMGRIPWSRAVELGEGKTQSNWLATAVQYGVRVVEHNVYGNVSSKFKDLSKKFAQNITTYWDFAYGYDRYKTDRYFDD